MLLELNLDNLKELDGGRLRAAFDAELKKVLEDLQDRPGMKQPRKVTMTLDIKPEVDEQGELYNVVVQFHVTHKIPSRRTQQYSMQVRSSSMGPMACFNELSLDNPNQGTLEFE